MEISKMVTLSTGHISEETNELLKSSVEIQPVPVHAIGFITVFEKFGCGYFIYVPFKWNQKEKSKDMPEDLFNIISFAAKNDCDIVCLDVDGDYVEELQKFDW